MKRSILMLTAIVMLVCMMTSVTAFAAETTFTDVREGTWYYDAVYWAVAEGVTNGTSATTFSPDDICNRAQAVTFIWRALGSPEPASTVHNFTDIKTSDYFYKAVLWALENNVTTGVSETRFAPKEECSRAQIVTFLWRAMGAEILESTNPFSDVKATSWFVDAVLWAVANDVTTGTSATKFSPSKSCTRAQIVTFLYRAMSITPVEITAQPADAEGCSVGDSISFTVEAQGGKAPYTYAWQYKSSAMTDFAPIGNEQIWADGFDTSSLGINVTEELLAGKFAFRCVVTDARGKEAVSDVAEIKYAPLQIASQPADAEGCYRGDSISFDVAVTGGCTPYTYEWQYRIGSAEFKGFTSDDSFFAENFDTDKLTLTLVDSTFFEFSYEFRCVITDAAGNSVASNGVKLIAGESLDIASQPTDQRGGFDSGVNFDVTVTGGRAPYTYKWEIYTSDTGAYANVESGPLYSGCDTNKLTVTVTKGCSDLGTKFRCVITDAAGNNVTSGEALLLETLYVAENPVSGNTVDIFTEQTLSAEAKGGVGSLTYQWQVKADYMTDWEDILTPGGYQDFNTPTLKLSVTSDDVRYNNQYRCKISDESGETVYTSAASFNVIYPELRLIKNPLDTYCKDDGMFVEFAVEAVDGMVIQGGSALYNYSWQYSVDGSPEWKPLTDAGISWVTGENTETLTVKGVPEAFTSSYTFRCVVTDAVGDTVTSYEAMLMAYKPMSFAPYDTLYFATINDEKIIQIFADGGIPDYTYQWFFRIDGMSTFAEITSTDTWADAGNKNYIILNLPKEILDANLRIYMVATDRQGEWIASDVITIKPELSVTAENTEVYSVLGDVNTVKVNVIGGQAPYTYKWSIYNKDGTYANLAASTSNNTYSSKMFEYNATFRDTKDYYVCTVTDATGKSVTSENIYLKEMIPLEIITHPYSDELYHVGDYDRFFVEVEGGVGPYTYTWEEKLNYQSFFSVISGTTTDKLDYTFTANHRKYAVTIRCTVTDSLGNVVTSNEFTPKYGLWIDETDTTYTVSDGTQRILSYNIKGGVAPYTSKWYVYDVDTGISYDPANINYSGFTVNGNNLTVKVTAHVAEHYKFYCEVSDASGDLIISPMKFFKVNTVGFKNDLASRYYVEKTGDRVYLKVDLNEYATSPVKYTVEYSDDTYAAGAWSTKKIASGQGLTYEISYLLGTSERDNHARYRIIATDANGNSVTSNVMSVVFNPRIESYTVSRDFNVGTSTTFTVNVTNGTAPYTYKWQYSTTAEGEYIDCISSSESFTGENTATLSIGEITSSMENYTFRCVITDAKGGTVTSTPAVFIVRPIMITSQPQSVVAEKGTTFTFKGLKVTGGDGALKYQWQYAYTTTPTSDSDFANCFLAPAYFSNYDTNELTVFYNTGFEKNTFRCKITDEAGNVIYSDYVYVTKA